MAPAVAALWAAGTGQELHQSQAASGHHYPKCNGYLKGEQGPEAPAWAGGPQVSPLGEASEESTLLSSQPSMGCLSALRAETDRARSSQSESPPAETGTSPRRGAAAPVQPAAIASCCLALAFHSASVPEVLPAFQKMQKMRPPGRREENKYRTGQTLSQKRTCQLGGWKRCLKQQVATE